MSLLDELALKETKYREDKARDLVIVEFEGFPLFELPRSYFKNARDFRDYPRIAEELLRTWGNFFIDAKGKDQNENKDK